MNIIGKKSTEAASIHSDFQCIVSLNFAEPLTYIHGSTPFISARFFTDFNGYIP